MVEANRAAMDQREAARRNKVVIMAIPVLAVLAGSFWLLKPHSESFLAEMKVASTAATKVWECGRLPEGESARCLKVLKAEEACSHVGGVDSNKCLSDYLNR